MVSGTSQSQLSEDKKWCDEFDVMIGPMPCEHLPDQLNFVDMAYKGNEIHCYYECRCGKRVMEVFSYSKTCLL